LENNILLDVKNLTKKFYLTKGLIKKKVGAITAVNNVTFHINRGETFGLVGESGCGKTTTGRCIIRAVEPTQGEVYYQEKDGPRLNLPDLEKQAIKKVRRKIRLIFQDPYSSLNPRMNVFRIISTPLVLNKIERNKVRLEEMVANMLQEVGLNPDHMHRYPHAFSGGQRQRIAVAKALISSPNLVLADEPVSALDVSVQAQVLNLLKRLKEEYDLTFLFIAHNLAVIEHMCDRIAVMYMGRIVEMASKANLFDTPKHPYTEALLAAIPVTDPDYNRKDVILQGEVADLLNPPSGCYFHPRCRYAQDICRAEEPPLVGLKGDSLEEGEQEHFAACHLSKELSLKGIEI
jgi:peptide/nickel transport system ATP-binding protein